MLNVIVNESASTSKSTVSKLKNGEWFRIDRRLINESKKEINRKCREAGRKGKALLKRFAVSNKIADENPEQYPSLIETFIFRHYCGDQDKTIQEMREMCEKVGDGMCDEIICDLELQMRICNGELVKDLVKKADQLPYIRVIKLRNGETGFFGGAADYHLAYPPTTLVKVYFIPYEKSCKYTAYAFRRVLS